MLTNTDIEKKLKELKPILRETYFVEKIGYFGSFSRNEQNEKSDLDILVSFKKPLGWSFFDLRDLLENKLGLKIDLVTENALKPRLKENILKDVKYI